MTDTTRAANARRGLATVASLLLSAVLLGRLLSTLQSAYRAGELAFTLLLIATPAVGGSLVWARKLPAQLLARGTWWSFLLMGGVVAAVGHGDARHVGLAMSGCSAVALLAAGGLGLDVGDRRFQPVAFRRTLLLALVLAMADTGALLWLGLGNAIFEGRPSVLLLVPFMIAGVVGLLRLRTWGLIVSLASNAALVTLALCDVVYLPDPVRPLFVATALLQLGVPLPMLVSIVSERRRRAGS